MKIGRMLPLGAILVFSAILFSTAILASVSANGIYLIWDEDDVRAQFEYFASYYDWDSEDEELYQDFLNGLEVELEHGNIPFYKGDPIWDVTNNDLEKTAKIVTAHLRENIDYYDLLLEMEHKGEKFWEDPWEIDEKNNYPQNRKIGKNILDELYFSVEDATYWGAEISITWETSDFQPDQFALGMTVELEHGDMPAWNGAPETDVTDNDELTTAKVAFAHFNEFSDYYFRLWLMETMADAKGHSQSP